MTSPVARNEMEKKMDHEITTGIYSGLEGLELAKT